MAAEREASELEKKHQGLSKGVDELKLKHLLLAGGVGATAGVAAGVALGAGICLWPKRVAKVRKIWNLIP